MDVLRKALLLILLTAGCCLAGASCPAQGLMQLGGSVVDSASGRPLREASVYLSQTTFGTTTGPDGGFRLSGIPAGTYKLIVSYVGFGTREIPVDERHAPGAMKIALTPDITTLQGITVRASRRGVTADQNQAYYLAFRKYFLGEGPNAQRCIIENPEVLRFNLDKETGVFRATASAPLVIRNKALGYTIYYDLQEFRYDHSGYHLTFYGYPRFEPMPELGKRRQRICEKNRARAYLGSMRHFMKSLTRRQLKENGFGLNWLVRIEDPYTRAAREAPDNPLSDSLAGLPARVPMVRQLLYSGEVPYDSVVQQPADTLPGYTRLRFPHSLQVTPFHYKTPQFNAYFGWKKDAPLSAMTRSSTTGGTAWISQTSSAFPPSVLTMNVRAAYIDPNGVLTNPLAVAVEGAWAYKQVADLLPLDYTLPEAP